MNLLAIRFVIPFAKCKRDIFVGNAGSMADDASLHYAVHVNHFNHSHRLSFEVWAEAECFNYNSINYYVCAAHRGHTHAAMSREKN